MPETTSLTGDGQSKYTVMLTPRSVAALREAATTNYETRTNVINRAVQLYLLITRLIGTGWTIVARDEARRLVLQRLDEAQEDRAAYLVAETQPVRCLLRSDSFGAYL